MMKCVSAFCVLWYFPFGSLRAELEAVIMGRPQVHEFLSSHIPPIILHIHYFANHASARAMRNGATVCMGGIVCISPLRAGMCAGMFIR